MKNVKSLFITALVGFAMISCTKDPVACFTLDKTSATVNTPIVADASCSIDAEKFMWMATEDGGQYEGTVDKPEIATYTYSTPGTYEITLKVKKGRLESEISKTVTITE